MGVLNLINNIEWFKPPYFPRFTIRPSPERSRNWWHAGRLFVPVDLFFYLSFIYLLSYFFKYHIGLQYLNI